MNLADIPIGKSTSSDHGDYLTIIARINVDYVIVDQIEKATENSVLKMKVYVETGKTEAKYIDYNFWTIYVDGAPYDGNPISGSITSDLQNRIMNISTK